MASWKATCISVTGLVIFSSLAYLLFSVSDPIRQIRQHHFDPSVSLKDHHRHFRAPAENPWAELDEVEASQVYTWLHENSHLLMPSDAQGVNALNLIELLRPNKSDVVDY